MQRSRLCFSLVLMAALVLAGCASPTGSQRATGASPSSLSAPEACRTYAKSPAPVVAGGEPIVQAVGLAKLPAGSVLSPGVEVSASVDKPGMYDATVHLCSLPLGRAKLIEVGDTVAAALNADPSRTKLSTLTLQPWVQIGTDAIAADATSPSISIDFQAYAAGSSSAPADSAWH